jgi:hypothetical protein
MNKRDNIIKWTIVSIFVLLYTMVSAISTIHVIDFFKLSNPDWLAITLAISFEVGAAACLGAIVILNKTSKALVWMLFILITVMQMMGNMYYAYSHIHNFQGWIELFGLVDEEIIAQKRILSIVSGAILPIVALGFIKSLVDYIRPSEEIVEVKINDQITDSVTQIEEVEDPKELSKKAKEVWAKVNELREEGKLHIHSEEDLVEPSALAFTPYDVEEEYEEEVQAIEVEGITEDDIKEAEQKSHTDIEVKLAKAIANNPELKEKLNEEIKKLESSNDKYSNPDESPIANINNVSRTFGGM